jgi:hypothetical protein
VYVAVSQPSIQPLEKWFPAKDCSGIEPKTSSPGTVGGLACSNLLEAGGGGFCEKGEEETFRIDGGSGPAVAFEPDPQIELLV